MHALERTILVTGVSSGIGLAVAEQLLKYGHTVLGIARRANQVLAKYPRFAPIILDVSQLDVLPQKIKELQQAYPALDAVIFCAGKGQFGAIEQFSYEQIDALMTLNFTSQVYLTKALLPDFKRKAQSDLIYIGSEAALKGSRNGAMYCASKFALRGFTQALREDCGKSNVRVSLINPGMVKTPFFNELSFEPGDHQSNSITAENVSEAVIYVLNSPTNMVIDEINLSPLNKVVKFKK